MLGENIKNFRKQNGFTQETLAQELNVVRQTVSKWEKGYSVPDAIMLERIAELFEVSVGDLLGNDRADSEQKMDLEQISAQLSVLNNQIAKELARKRKIRKICLSVFISIFIVALLSFVLLILFRISLVAGQKVDYELDNAISQTILKENSQYNLLGECLAESHLIYGTKKHGKLTDVYLMEGFSTFGFKDGFFVDVSGHLVPAVFTFRHTADGYELVKKEYAEDGSENITSIKKMFPFKFERRAINGPTEAEREAMWIQEVMQAQKYLSSINRGPGVYHHEDLEYRFLSDVGISTEVSNKIVEMRLEYDSSIGNHEVIENGKRFVYQTDYDEINDCVTFTKFEYESNEVTEFIAVDAANGEIIKDMPKPKTARYKKGKFLPPGSEQAFTTVAVYE